MLAVFIDDEDSYFQWVADHPGGFIANTDKAGKVAVYPMVHRASHKLLTSREHFTDADYFKVCSDDIEKLEEWSMTHRNKSLTYCQVCMKGKNGHS